MKTGKTILELAQELDRQRESKRDFIADTRKMNMVEAAESADKVRLQLIGANIPALGLTKVAHGQLAQHLDIPRKYYDRMLAERPSLLAENVNQWLQAEGAKRMVRTLDGRARALLSDAFRPLDDADLAEAVIPAIKDLNLEIISCDVTETRLYIKACDKDINRNIPSGRMGDGKHTIFDTVCPAIVISNSEVGMGALSVETAVWTRACTNLAIFAQRSMRKYHVGGRAAVGEDLAALFTEKTKRITDAAVWSQVTDVVRGAFDQAKFDASLEEIRGMAEQKITGDVTEVVELTGDRLKLTDGERKSVLRNLIEGGDLSRYGMFNAITRAAEDLPDYDRATEFERMGGQIIELPANDWRRIAEAA